MIRRTRETYAFINEHPEPSTPEEALAHVLAIYSDEDDGRLMVQAAHNVYGDGVSTGLTMGDLRALAARLPAGPATDERAVAYRSPGTRTLYCVTCARQETGWQPVTADSAQQDAVCDFCGGRVHAIASRTIGSVIAQYLDTPTA